MQRSPTDCGVFGCNRESSIMRRLWPTKGCCAMLKKRILVLLYGCETWSLTQRKEHRLKVFENRVLRRIFGPTRDRVTWKLRRLHKEEFYNLYSSPNVTRLIKSRRMSWVRYVADRKVAYKVLVGKTEEKRDNLENLGVN